MELEQVLEKKQTMERTIYNYISKEFNTFREETGLYPNGINIDMDYVTELGVIRGDWILTGCNIKVEL